MGSLIESFLSIPSIRFLLDNGLSVIFLPTENTRVLALQVWVKTGSIDEGCYLGSGISHFVEHMVFKGTKRRSYVDIFKETQIQGAKINAYTSFDRTVYTYDGTVDAFEQGLDVLEDMLLHSIFPEKELEKEREVILREINMSNDDPDDRLSQILFETAFHQHPYRYPIIGIRNLFEQLTREDLINYWQSRYVPNNMTLVVAGALEESLVKQKLQQYWGKQIQRSITPVFIPREPFQLAERDYQEYGDYQLVRGVVAYKIPGIGHKDGTRLQVLASVLGDGESSILYQKMREEKQLVYSIDVSSWMANGHGLFWIQYTCDPGKREKVEECLKCHLAEWLEEGLTDNAVKKAFNRAIIAELDARKTVSGKAHHIGWAEVCLGDGNYPKHYLEQLSNLDVSLVKSVVPKYFKEVSCSRVSLEPRSCKPSLKETVIAHKEQVHVECLEIEGVKIFIQQCSDFPKTHVQALFRAGSLYEPTNMRGITQLLATLLTKDTQSQSALEIAKQIETIGGQISSFSGINHLGFSLEVLAKDTELGCVILQNALTEPLFLEKVFEIEKQAQLAALQELKDDVFYLGFERIRQQFFHDHPYCIGQLGNIEGIKNITLESLKNYFEKIIVSSNCMLSVVSQWDTEAIVKVLTPLCHRLSKKSFQSITDPLPILEARRIEDVLNKEQSMVFSAYPIAGMAEEDFYIGEILEELFNGLSSSFVEEVREKRGLAYTVGATRLLGLKNGMFCLFAGTQKEQIQVVEAEMLKGIRRVLERKLTQEEFDLCKTCLKVNRQLRLQTIGRKAFAVGYNALLGLSLDQWLSYDEKIDHITLDTFYDCCLPYLRENLVNTLLLTPSFES